MKVIVHYLNGSSYTFNNCCIDGSVDWMSNSLVLIDAGNNCNFWREMLDEDVIYVEERNPIDNLFIQHVNPKYEVSCQVSIVTAKTRRKLNNKQEIIHE